MNLANKHRVDRLRAIRRQRNRSMSYVAAHIGYTISYIWDLEKGNRTWNTKLVTKYLKALQ